MEGCNSATCKANPGICFNKLRESSDISITIVAILEGHISNTNQERYRLSQLARYAKMADIEY
jgi:hypothetical protein